MKHLLFLSFLTLAAAGGTARAQYDVLGELYGMGYHAYFRSDLISAQNYLTMAIDEGSKDPRAYYYRGLTYLCMGDTELADNDFRIGAAFEVDGYGRLIGRALDRIQGSHRMRIERARFAARLDAARSRGFEQPAPTPRTLPPVPAAPVPAPSPVDTMPMTDELAPGPAEVPGVPTDETPVVPDAGTDVPADADDPFGEAEVDAEDDMSTEEADPFGAEEAADSEGDDPFGASDEDMEADPFSLDEL